MKKTNSRLCKILALAAVLLPLLAGANTHTWSGAVNGLWSNTGNWSSGGVPTVGEVAPLILNFPASATRRTTTNDIGSLFFGYLAIDAINVTGTNYWFTGKGGGTNLLFTGYSSLFVLDNFYCTASNNVFDSSMNLVLQRTNALYTGAGATLQFNCLMSGPGGLTCAGSGSTIFQGYRNNTFTGAVNVQSGTVCLDNFFVTFDIWGNASDTSLPAIQGPLIIGVTSNSTPAKVYVLRSAQLATNCDITINPTGNLIVDNLTVSPNPFPPNDDYESYSDYGLDNTAHSLTLNGGTLDLGMARWISGYSQYGPNYSTNTASLTVSSTFTSYLSPNPTTTSMIYGPGDLHLEGCTSTVASGQLLLYSSSYGFNKFGPGNLTLLGSGTARGLTLSQSSASIISSNVFLYSLTVSNGAELIIQQPIGIDGDIYLAGRGTNGNSGALTILASNVFCRVWGALTLATNTAINVVNSSNQLTFAGFNDDTHVAGSGSFHKVGAGTLSFLEFRPNVTNYFTLGIDMSNIFSGTLYVDQGTLECGSSNAAYNGGIVFNGPIVIGTNGSPASTLLVLDGSEHLGTNSPITINDNGELYLGTNSQTVGALTLNGGSVVSGKLTLLGNVTAQNGLGAPFLFTSVSLGGADRSFNVAAGSSLNVFGAINDGGANAGVIKIGAGELDFYFSNTYSGFTTISGGKLGLFNQATLGSTNAGTIVANGAELDLKDGVKIGQEPLSMVGVGSDSNGALKGTGTNSWAGPISLTGAAIINVTNGGLTELSGIISGPYNLYKYGLGILLLNGAQPNTFSGQTTVVQGQLSLSKTNGPAIPGPLNIGDGAGGPQADIVRTYMSSQFAQTNAVYISSSGLLDVSGGQSVATAVGALSGAGSIQLGGHNLGVGYGDDSSIFAGIINGNPGVNFVKAGSGVLTLTGTSPFGGFVQVTAGTLLVNGSLATANLLPLNGGVLGGTGTVGAITSTTGAVKPGVMGQGTLNCGNVSLGSSTVYAANISGSAPGTGYNQLNVTGSVNLGITALQLKMTTTGAVGNQYTLLVNDASDAITGTFEGLAEGTTLYANNGVQFTISYHGGSGNDVVLTQTALPTPPQITGVTKLPNGDFALTGTISPNASCHILANTNLTTTNWVNLGGVTADGSGAVNFTDTQASQYPMRFYRIMNP